MKIFENIPTETLIELQENMSKNFVVIKNSIDRDCDHSAHYELMQSLISKILINFYELGVSKKYEKKPNITLFEILKEELRLELILRDWETNNYFVKN